MSLHVISLNRNISVHQTALPEWRWNIGSCGILDMSLQEVLITCTRWKTLYTLSRLPAISLNSSSKTWVQVEGYDSGARFKSRTSPSGVFKRNMSLYRISITCNISESFNAQDMSSTALPEWRWNTRSYAILDMLLRDVLITCSISDICNEANGV